MGRIPARISPARNDAEWLTRTLAYWKEGDSLPTLKYEDASPWFELPPGERGYGGGKIIPAEIPADQDQDQGTGGRSPSSKCGYAAGEGPLLKKGFLPPDPLPLILLRLLCLE